MMAAAAASTPGSSMPASAIHNDILGIDAECGVSCARATCHDCADTAFFDLLPEPNGMAAEPLEGVAAKRRPWRPGHRRSFACRTATRCQRARSGPRGAQRDPGEDQRKRDQRLPLSEGLAGTTSPVELPGRSADFHADPRIDLRLGHRIDSMDRAGRSLGMAGGRAQHFQGLALAATARCRTLALPDARLGRVV
jgi:hypothetical protein